MVLQGASALQRLVIKNGGVLYADQSGFFFANGRRVNPRSVRKALEGGGELIAHNGLFDGVPLWFSIPEK
jgi:hypothetical protein